MGNKLFTSTFQVLDSIEYSFGVECSLKSFKSGVNLQHPVSSLLSDLSVYQAFHLVPLHCSTYHL